MNVGLARDSGRTLTVFCPLGLSNRLRVLLSGLALAEATGRRFQMLWPLTPACAAPFADLFANDWPVETVAADVVADLPYISGWFGCLSDLLTAQEVDLVVGHPSWLLQPEQFLGHAPLMAHCQALFAALQPTPPIQQASAGFYQHHFRPTMIGVHLRRGDLLRQRPDTASNTAQAIAAVDHFLDAFPDAGIFLCTDDGATMPHSGRQARREGVQAIFRLRYGSRVVWTTPRSLDRRTPQAIQDAVVDLWLLRATDRVVGTQGSSFSEMAVFGRDIPSVLVAGATPGYQWLARWIQRLGIDTILVGYNRRHLGRDVPFPALLRHYVAVPYHWLRRIVRESQVRYLAKKTDFLTRRRRGV